MIQRELKIFEENCCGLGLCVKQTLYCTRPGLIDFFSIDEKSEFYQISASLLKKLKKMIIISRRQRVAD